MAVVANTERFCAVHEVPLELWADAPPERLAALEDAVRRDLAASLAREMQDRGAIVFDDKTDRGTNIRTFRAEARAEVPRPAPNPKWEAAMQQTADAFLLAHRPPKLPTNQIAYGRITYGRSGDLTNPFQSRKPGPLSGAKGDRMTLDEIFADTDTDTKPAPPKGPVKKDLKREVLAEVEAMLDEVEASLIPGTDPAFVVLLLRDKLAGLAK